MTKAQLLAIIKWVELEIELTNPIPINSIKIVTEKGNVFFTLFRDNMTAEAVRIDQLGVIHKI